MIEKVIKLIKEKTKRIFSLFPVTIISIIVCSIFLALFIDSSVDDDFVLKTVLFFFFFSTSSFFCELFFHSKKGRIISYIVSAIISLIFTLMITADTNDYEVLSIKICTSYVIILTILSFYKLYKDSGQSLGTYLVSVFSRSLIRGIIYSVLSTGLLTVSLVFAFLFLGEDGYDIVWRVEILLIGIYYFPSMIDALTNHEEKPLDFLKALIHYAMLSIVVLAFFVIYLYMIKIFVAWEIPSNQIFRILAILFIMSLPIWTMNEHYKDKSFLSKINHYLPIAFIPFIFLEIYSLGVRIMENGLTVIRYIGIMVILFEIVYVALYILKKEKLDVCFFVIIGFTIVSFLVPKFNMFDLSNQNQVNRILKYIDKDDLSNNEKKVIYGAYEYLTDSYNGRNYIDKYLKDKKETIDNILLNSNDYEMEKDVFIDENIDFNEIDIRGYNYLYNFDESYYNLSKNDLVVFVQHKEDNLDVTTKILEVIENNLNESYLFSEKNEIIFENIKIIITNINIKYNPSTETISYLDINGYILEK